MDYVIRSRADSKRYLHAQGKVTQDPKHARKYGTRISAARVIREECEGGFSNWEIVPNPLLLA